MSTEPEISSGAARTPWLAKVHPEQPRLTEYIDVDVAIIGGGISGLSVAYQLAREGRSVAVLEDGAIGSGETGRTTAHLSCALDDRFYRLEQLHGATGALQAFLSHKAAIREIEHIVQRESIDCDFVRLPGYLFAPPGDPGKVLDLELEAVKRLGIRVVRRVDRAPIEGFNSGPCLRFADQGQFHPTKYLSGLARAIQRMGGKIYERSHVDDYEFGKQVTLKVKDGGRVTAGSMVVATNAPIVSLVKMPMKQYAYRTYAISLEIPKNSVEKALFWDTEDPYHYVRTQGNLLIVGGEDHKTGQPHDEPADKRYGHLETWTRERFPASGRVVDRWSGQVLEPADGLAFIGRYATVDPRVYVATGDSGHGMTHGTIAGMLLRDLIVGKENSWAPLYDPSRTTLRSLGELVSENLNMIPQYGRWLTSGEGGSAQDLELGEGRVLRKGLKKVAVCRMERGELCTLSAVCPHLGAIVAWNAAEKTWDCPAHGSRFSNDGRVLNGPANSDLKRIRITGKKVKSRAGKSRP